MCHRLAAAAGCAKHCNTRATRCHRPAKNAWHSGCAAVAHTHVHGCSGCCFGRTHTCTQENAQGMALSRSGAAATMAHHMHHPVYARNMIISMPWCCTQQQPVLLAGSINGNRRRASTQEGARCARPK